MLNFHKCGLLQCQQLKPPHVKEPPSYLIDECLVKATYQFQKLFDVKLKYCCCCSYGRRCRSYLTIAQASQYSFMVFWSTCWSVSCLGQYSRCSSSMVEFGIWRIVTSLHSHIRQIFLNELRYKHIFVSAVGWVAVAQSV